MLNPSTLSIGVIQLCSGDDVSGNIDRAGALVGRAAQDGAQLICLPENSFYMRREAHHQHEVEPQALPRYCMANHPGVLAAQAWARAYGAWILIGSIAAYEGDSLPYNRSVLLAPSGEIAACYDKIHLFDVELAGGESYMESARIQAGERAVVAATPWGGLGLSICYDIRFPYLYRDLAKAGASLLAIPAAFTVPTGMAHWHVLQRARAIETGCFVIAPAQSGEHPGGRKSYGHSLLVSPWGEVLLDLDDGPGYGVVQVDMGEVTRARGVIPSLVGEKDYTLVTR